MSQSPPSKSEAMSRSKPESNSGIVKHRACDECRTRKLACSKEPDGCSRCRKEGILCVYSAQKPMGRPRKRRHMEDAEEQPLTTQPEMASLQDSLRPSSHVQPDSLPVSSDLDLDFASFYHGDNDYLVNTDMSTMDFFAPVGGIPSMAPDFASFAMPYSEPQLAASGLQFGGVDLLGGINFDDKDPANKQVSEDITTDMNYIYSKAPVRFAEDQPAPAHDLASAPQAATSHQVSFPYSSQHQNQTPNPESSDASTSSATTPASSPNSDVSPKPAHKSIPHINCACLSQIYLSLDSLSRLPDDIGAAMRAARNAAKTAHNLITCPTCSTPYIDDPSRQAPMQAFQNTMLLGMLIPTVVNAYVRILELVDEVTAEAKAKGQTLLFRFVEYGGLWGELEAIDKFTCRTVETYDNKEMEPDKWRMTIRAVLKIDIYGFDVDCSSVLDGSRVTHRHLGLKDVIGLMEERSNHRHDQIDAMVAAGLPHPMQGNPLVPNNHRPTGSKDDRNCLKIVEMARTALDNLVIA
ncbi:hypothetical protein VDGD_04114 [Verticillium dahliae]|nr:hypothetical protein VdG1_01586 [Verticillium dahliae VDG1]RBQ65192.1 hypothetical protein VDGD_04114 [Verticillium dahliae]